MDIALINPLAHSGQISTFPLGLLFLEGHLTTNGFDCCVYDRNGKKYHDGLNEREIDEDLLSMLDREQPSFIGITLMTDQYHDAKSVAQRIKRRCPESIVLLGGVHPTFEPERTLRDISDADLVVRGPGEKPLENLLSGNSIDSIANILYRDPAGVIRENKLTPYSRESSPDITFQLLEDLGYWRNETIISNGLNVPELALMVTSQGCPGRCTFCVDDRFLGGGFIDNDDRVLDTMERLHSDFGRKAFFFADRLFRISRRGIESFCQRKTERGLAAFPWSSTIRADCTDDSIAMAMKEAGCFQVYLGLESGSQRILDLVGKESSVSQIIKAADIFNRNKILVQGSFLYGLPSQTEADLEANITMFGQMDIFDSSCNPFLPSPGSCLYDQLVADGVLNPDDPELWKDTVSLSAQLAAERNYSAIPFERYKEIFYRHATYMQESCISRRPTLIAEYGLEHIFYPEEQHDEGH